MSQALPILALMDETVTPVSLAPNIPASVTLTNVVGVRLGPRGHSKGTFKYNIDGNGWIQIKLGDNTELLTPTTSLYVMCDIACVVSITTYIAESDVHAGGFVLGGLGGDEGGGIVPVAPISLSGDRTLAITDDQATFYCTTTLTITIPAGLVPMPQITIIPPPTGSVTLHPATGVLLTGVTADQAFNYANYQQGIALLPSYGTQDAYGVTAQVNWNNLPGHPRDSVELAALLDAKAAVAAAPTIINQAVYNLSVADNGGFLILSPAGGDRTLNLVGTLSAAGVRFRCTVVYQNLAAKVGRWRLAQSGSTIQAAVTASGGTLGVGATAIPPGSSNLVTGAVFLGVSGINNVAAAMIEADGTNGEFQVIPLCGQINAT